MKRIISTTALAAAVLLGASACSTGGEVASAPATAPASTSAAPVEAPAGTAPAPAQSEPKSDMTAAFGETFVYEDGIEVTVSAPEISKAGKYAAGADATNGEIQVFTVTLVNGTSEVLEPASTYITVNYGPDGVSADNVFDSGNGLGMTFEGKILPGKKQVGKAAFAIPATETDVLLSVAPSFAHDAALFQAAK